MTVSGVSITAALKQVAAIRRRTPWGEIQGGGEINYQPVCGGNIKMGVLGWGWGLVQPRGFQGREGGKEREGE